MVFSRYSRPINAESLLQGTCIRISIDPLLLLRHFAVRKPLLEEGN